MAKAGGKFKAKTAAHKDFLKEGFHAGIPVRRAFRGDRPDQKKCYDLRTIAFFHQSVQ